MLESKEKYFKKPNVPRDPSKQLLTRWSSPIVIKTIRAYIFMNY
jgi:hypothetical protein